ncbi:neuromedin-U receptor 2-like [Patiria miniata]|uniref:G-protein coupled receptors family 1 profile domain-containing protein n=1 Tax=Patiria miniata TaxID=46514 RepID=A0A914AST5_PATMI|nr:neuromedin-U receptor 2-like [Patiria miniata]
MSSMNETRLSTNDSEHPGNEYKWICHIITTEGVIGVLGNLLVCFVILRVKFLHNMTNYLLVNLAVADMLLCLQAFLLYFFAFSKCAIVHYVPAGSVERQIFCRLLASDFLSWALSYVSAYSLCLVTLERYVAIVHPLKYQRKVTASRIARLVALIWVVPFLYSLPFVFTIKPSDDPDQACSEIQYPHQAFPIVIGVLSFLMDYLLPITLMSLAYYKIQVTLKRQAKALNLQHARAAAYDLVIARQRLVSMLTIVLGALIILWTPAYLAITICLQASRGRSHMTFCDSVTFQHIRGVCSSLFYINSIVNPVIYEFKYKKFRQGFKVAFCGCFQKKLSNRVENLTPLQPR